MQKACVGLSRCEALGGVLERTEHSPDSDGPRSEDGCGLPPPLSGQHRWLPLTRLSLRREDRHCVQTRGQVLIPTPPARGTVLRSRHLCNHFTPLFPPFDPDKFESVLALLKQALLGRRRPCLWCILSAFLFCPFVAFGYFSSSGIFLFLVPFISSPPRTDSLARALISTFALRCKWLIEDVFLLPGVSALEQGYKFLRVEFQINKPSGRGARGWAVFLKLPQVCSWGQLCPKVASSWQREAQAAGCGRGWSGGRDSGLAPWPDFEIVRPRLKILSKNLAYPRGMFGNTMNITFVVNVSLSSCFLQLMW